ncbi:MAG: hypothetical protein ACN4E2_04290 [Nitrospinota bacterium]
MSFMKGVVMFTAINNCFSRRVPTLASLVLLTALSLTLLDSSDNRACAAVSGCVATSEKNTSTSGLQPTDLDAAGVDVLGGDAILQTGATDAIDVSNIKIPFNQDVYFSFIYEGATDDSSLGFFEYQVLLDCFADAGMNINFTTEANINNGVTNLGIPFTELYKAHTYCKTNKNINLINFILPALKQSTGFGGVVTGLSDLYNRDEWCLVPTVTPPNPDDPNHNRLRFNSLTQTGDPCLLTAHTPTNPSRGGWSAEEAYREAGFLVNNNGSNDLGDVRLHLGTFTAGTELVFFLVRKNSGNTTRTFYSKPTLTSYGWSFNNSDNVLLGGPAGNAPKCPSTPGGSGSLCKLGNIALGDTATSSVGCGSGTGTIDLIINLDEAAPEDFTDANRCSGGKIEWDNSPSTPSWTQGILTGNSRQSLLDLYDINFTGKITVATLEPYKPFNNFVALAPEGDKYKWLIGAENQKGGGDLDFNDVVFLLERKSGGVIELKESEALSPTDPAAYITSTTIKVKDTICAGGEIKYSVSVEDLYGNRNWIEIDRNQWQIVREGGPTGPIVTNWNYGEPETTYREAVINFAEAGTTGTKLRWKAELSSTKTECAPVIDFVDLAYVANVEEEFSRSTPVPLAHMLYRSSYATPSRTGKDRGLRGHMRAWERYNPNIKDSTDNPNYLSLADPADPAAEIATYGALSLDVIHNSWDGGKELKTSSYPNRKIYTPKVEVTLVENELLATGDDTRSVFDSLQLRNSSGGARGDIVLGTLEISAGSEILKQSSGSTLEGDAGGTADFNRQDGIITNLVFATPPQNNVRITATYYYYSKSALSRTNEGLIEFEKGTRSNPSKITPELLGLDESSISSAGRIIKYYDFNADQAVDNSDVETLIDWVTTRDVDYKYNFGAAAGLGSTGGTSPTHTWPLAAIDRSSPSILGSRGFPVWSNKAGTQDLTDDLLKFICEAYVHGGSNDPDTYLFVGSSMGMLHAFNAGKFRPFAIDTSGITTCSTSAGVDAFVRALSNQQTMNRPGSGSIKDFIHETTDNRGNSVTIVTNQGYFEWEAGAEASNIGTGKEEWAFIPQYQLPRLKNNYTNSPKELASVNSSPSLALVKFSDGEFRRVLLSATGSGGDSLFALDVTDPANPELLWEFSDSDLFRSNSSPAIALTKLTTGEYQWRAYFTSGQAVDADANIKVFALDVEEGPTTSSHGEIELDKDDKTKGQISSGQPVAVDTDGNGIIDRLYLSTSNGYIYKILIPDNTNDDPEVCKYLYQTDDGHGIYSAPAVVMAKLSGASTAYPTILFGTSDNPNDSSDGRKSDGSLKEFTFYAVQDKELSKTDCGAVDINETWKVGLPEGHRVFGSPFVSDGKVGFGTSTAETDDPCAVSTLASGADGNFYVLNVDDGSEAEVEENIGNNVAGLHSSGTKIITSTVNNLIKESGGSISAPEPAGSIDLGGGMLINSWREITL